MSKNTDTRALTREAYPHILATGENASVANVKEWVRQVHGIPDWNPSATTVQDELKKIRTENGKALLNGVRFPGIDPLLAELTGEYFQKIHALLREAAASELEAARREAGQLVATAKLSVQAAEEQTAATQAELSTARQDFERREIKFNADIEHQAQTISELRQSLQDLGTTHAASEARNVELAKQVERITAERTADANRHDNQLQLANDRYRELEKAKLMELDNARTQRDRALADLTTVKAELADVRIQVGVRSVEAAELRGEAKALREQVGELTERANGLLADNSQLKNENVALEQSRSLAETTAEGLQRQVFELSESVRVQAESNARLKSDLGKLEALNRESGAE